LTHQLAQFGYVTDKFEHVIRRFMTLLEQLIVISYGLLLSDYFDKIRYWTKLFYFYSNNKTSSNTAGSAL